jgi:hypothetical protein
LAGEVGGVRSRCRRARTASGGGGHVVACLRYQLLVLALLSFADPHYANRDQLWLRADETRAQIITNYHRACAHADATIDALPIDTEATVPWWPSPHVMLFNVLVHVLTETNRHAGHAGILREQVHGASDAGPTVNWPAHQAQIEQAARRAAPPGD